MAAERVDPELPPARHHWRWHLGAVAIYTTLSVLILDHGASITNHVLGIGSDPYLFMWCLAWWPWAITHHLNPLFTNLVWQPTGIHLAWTTCIPLLALLAAPITLAYGPAASFNILTIISPVLAAYCAYLLCFRLTQKQAASLIGGYLFGFSSFQMSECLEELNLQFGFVIPLLLLLAINRLEGRVSRRVSVILATLLLAVEFYISVEIFATTVFFGAIAWLLAYSTLAQNRIVLRHFLLDAVTALVLTTILVFPQLISMLLVRDVVVPKSWVFVTSAHFFNLIVPSAETILSDPALHPLSYSLFGLVPEYDVTTGLPLICVLYLCARESGRLPVIRLSYWMLFIILVASLGPQLWWGRELTKIVMPWRLLIDMPFISSALTTRFAVYVSLIIAVLTAYWVAKTSARPRAKLALGLLACGLLLPQIHSVKPLPVSRFFASGHVQQVLGKQVKLLILPGRTQDPSPLWQVEDNFGFSHTRGFLGVPTQAMMAYPAIVYMSFGLMPRHLDADMKSLCLQTNTQYVIAGPDTSPELMRLMNNLGWLQRQVDDVTIFTVVN